MMLICEKCLDVYPNSPFTNYCRFDGGKLIDTALPDGKELVKKKLKKEKEV